MMLQFESHALSVLVSGRDFAQPLLRDGTHGAEFVHAKGASPLSDACLGEDGWPTILELHQEGEQEQQGAQEHEQGQAGDHVENALGDRGAFNDVAPRKLLPPDIESEPPHGPRVLHSAIAADDQIGNLLLCHTLD
jgi:hypothetical protein